MKDWLVPADLIVYICRRKLVMILVDDAIMNQDI